MNIPCKCEGGIHGTIVVLAACFTWTCTFGTSNSIGLYNIDLQKSFNSSSATVSLVGAINMGVFFGAGPVAGIMNSKWGRRKTAVVGAIISSIGLVALPFSPHVIYMYFFYGILNGFGGSLTVVSSQELCGEHFFKYRALTSSLVLSGTGLGSTTFPIIINNFIQTYGWRGSLLLLCGLNLHLIAFALLLFPVSNQASGRKKEYGGDDYDVKKKETNKHITESTDGSGFDLCMYSISQNDELNEKEHYIKENEENFVGKLNLKMSLYGLKCKSQLMKVKNFHFVIFLISTGLFNFGYNAVVIFLPQHSVAVGFDEEDASLALTLLGAGLFVGCVIGGLLGRRHWKVIVLILGCVGFGVAAILLDFYHRRIIYMSLSFLTGMFSGFETAYLFAIACDILEDDAIGIGFGFVMLFVGVGCMAGPPVAGSLVDIYDDTSCVLYISAVTTILSGLIMCPYVVQQISLKGVHSLSPGKGENMNTSDVTIISVVYGPDVENQAKTKT